MGSVGVGAFGDQGVGAVGEILAVQDKEVIAVPIAAGAQVGRRRQCVIEGGLIEGAHLESATGEAKSGDTALVIGFGAGLVYAATVVTLP